MRQVFLFLIVLSVFSSRTVFAQESSVFINVRTDSTYNEKLERITKSVLALAKKQQLKIYGADLKLSNDTTGIKELITDPLVKEKFVRDNGLAFFSPQTFFSHSSIYFSMAETKTLLADSDYTYLEKALAFQQSTVWYQKVIDITPNEKFLNGFNNAQNGIARTIESSIFGGGGLAAYPCNLQSSSPLLPPGYRRFNLSQVEHFYVAWDSSGYFKNGSAIRVDPVYNFFRFIFPATLNGNLVQPDTAALFALGPVEHRIDGSWNMPFVVRYNDLRHNINSFQEKVLFDYIRGDYNRDVVWAFSESVFLPDKTDTSIMNALHTLWLANSNSPDISAYADYKLYVKLPISQIRSGKKGFASLDETRDSIFPWSSGTKEDQFDNIAGFRVAWLSYRTDPKNYVTASEPIAIAPVGFDGKTKTYQPVFYWQIAELRYRFPNQYTTIMNYVHNHQQAGFGMMTVTGDSTISDGTKTFFAVNLMHGFTKGKQFYCNYMLLEPEHDGNPARICISSIGNNSRNRFISSEYLVPIKIQNALFGRGQWGYCDTSGVFCIAPQFEYAEPFSEGRAVIGRTNNPAKQFFDGPAFTYGYIDSTGQLMGSCFFWEAREFHCGRGAVKKDNRWGFVDSYGQQIVPCKFLEVRNYASGYAAVRDSTGWHYLDLNGGFVGPEHCETLLDFENDFARVKQNGKWGLLNKKMKFILQPEYDTIAPFIEELALVEKDKLFGFVNEKGKFDIPLKYSGAHSFSDGWCSAAQNGKWGYIDKKQRVKIPFEYENTGYYGEGLATVKKDGKWGCVDAGNKRVIACVYDSLTAFNDGHGFFYTRTTRSWGIVDVRGNELLYYAVNDFQFSWFSDYSLGVCIGGTGQYLLFFDARGKKIFPYGFQQYYPQLDSRGYSHDTGRQYFLVSALNDDFYINRQGKPYLTGTR